MLRKRLAYFSVGVALIILVMVPRLFALDAVRSPDEDRWQARTAGYTRKLANGQWSQLLQAPHPGATVVLLSATANATYTLAMQKLPLAFTAGLLILALGYVYGTLWGTPAGILVVLLLAYNPLLFAHSRVFGLDALLSLLLSLSLGLLFLWRASMQKRYAVAAGATAAAAILTKLPGLVILPTTAILAVWWLCISNRKQDIWRAALLWLLSFTVAAIVILPPFLLDTVGTFRQLADTFTSPGYQSEHLGSVWYYAASLFFFSAPAHVLVIVLLPLFFTKQNDRKQSVIPTEVWGLLLSLVLFITMMSFGSKKGDRYILPALVSFDLLAAAGLTGLLKMWFDRTRRPVVAAALVLVGALIVWQAVDIVRLHPYNLAYVNPLTKQWYGDRHLGWGEGLDLAAEYLNQKPHASELTVASYYNNEFATYFVGNAIPAHQHDAASVDYVVLYRSMFDRGTDAWETDVLNLYRACQPEHTISLNNLPYAWIYNRHTCAV